MLLYGCNQTVLIGLGTSIDMCLEVAPNKIIHQSKVGAAGRPLLFGDEVVAMLLEPEEEACYQTQGRPPAFHVIQGNHDHEEVWGHDVALIRDHTEHQNRLRKFGFHHFENILRADSDPPTLFCLWYI